MVKRPQLVVAQNTYFAGRPKIKVHGLKPSRAFKVLTMVGEHYIYIYINCCCTHNYIFLKKLEN
jgi:hypothetical protein